ncbi:D-hexose-6-phosphate mutarotase [Vibrio gallicus]|uniref:D-hexose-6-phosphate mutarotase n=1 Tax=Vibrio gallicus TaxID=190897 RepID=UPI0021C4B569|nr:D-hexose-6-phosphate mutarotase [Vibrio gallicus]
MDLYQLPAVTALSDCVTTTQKDNLKIVRVMHPKAKCAVSLFGGHVLSFIPQGKPEAIWMSDEAKFDGKTALRGGIPVCWPWFARMANPAHGFCRTSEWELVEHRENETGVMLRLALTTTEQTFKIWPHHFELFLDIEVGDELKVSLKMHNLDEQAWKFSGALHTYLNVSDIHNTETIGMGDEYIDSLNSGALTQGGDVLTLSDTIDRVYTKPSDCITLLDKGFERQLNVKNHGANSAVLWNPWAQGAQAMGDMPDDGYKGMLCIEACQWAPDLESGTEIVPGGTYTLSTTISAG